MMQCKDLYPVMYIVLNSLQEIAHYNLTLRSARIDSVDRLFHGNPTFPTGREHFPSAAS